MRSHQLTVAPQNLITSKLHRPPAAGNLVRRTRLLDLLDQWRHVPLILVSAPAGSGKTTLLSDWLDTGPCPNAWVSLDEEDSALAVFLNYFIAALRTIVPDACAHTLAYLQASEPPPVHVLTRQLINDIESLGNHPALGGEGHFVVVLDDYHLLTGQAINELLTTLLRHPPHTLHLVLATRSDPALPLATLRAHGQLLEIRRLDLRFTVEETAAFLDQTVPVPVSRDVAAVLAGKMEGWVTGLYLVALNLRHVADPTAFLLEFSRSERYVMDYLLDEVLARQSPAIQEFLLKTSILDHLNERLCVAVVQPDSPLFEDQPYLEWLDKANLFLVTMDNQRQWFRYHHLFQQFLRYRLERWADAAQITDLHRRASAWYAANGFVEDAITHALTAGDETTAVQVIEAHRHAAMNQERWPQLEQWLRLLPRHLVDERPEPLLLAAWILQKRWRMADIGAYLDRIETLMASQSSPSPNASALHSEIDVLRSLVCYFELDGERTFTFASRALQTLPMSYSSARGLAYMYCTGGLQAMGDIPGAYRALHEGMREDAAHGNAFPSRVLTALCVLNMATGNLTGLSQAAAHFLTLATERSLAESIWWARYFQGCAAYLANDLATAETAFSAVVEQRYLAHGFSYSQSAFGLASVYLAHGAYDRAQTLVESVLAYALEMNNPRVSMDAEAFQAWLALRQGHTAVARRWVKSVENRIPLLPMTTFHTAIMTQARILSAQDTPADLHHAAELLARLGHYTESQHVTRFTIEVWALQALVENALGNALTARRVLRDALALAEPCGFVRSFVDLGPRMAQLLVRLGPPDGLGGFCAQVLRAFPAADVPGRVAAYLVPPSISQPTLVEPLTHRELEVLALLAQRLSTKEIARSLVISDRTVKRHTANIYQKLNVNSRREAVTAAIAHGILSAQPQTA